MPSSPRRIPRLIGGTAVLIALVAGNAVGQPRITIRRSTLVSKDDPKSPHAETFIAVNPRNAKNLVAASTVLGNGQWRDAVYSSFDAGVTWTRSRLAPSTPPTDFDGDPVVYFDDRGVAYLS